jgi:pseudaminic acid biosynthesis-associated methylase
MFRTEQERRWAGDLGDRYTKYNTIYVPEKNKNTLARGRQHLSINYQLFNGAIKGRQRKNIKSVLEFGAGVGLNLVAIRKIMPDVNMYAVEINATAAEKLRQVTDAGKIFTQSIFDDMPIKADLVISKGLLIHLNPRFLKQAYAKLYEHSNRYIFLTEHYSSRVEKVEYRGYSDAFWKRDFVGELMECYPDLRKLSSGIVHTTYQWCLLEKGAIGDGEVES